MRRFRAALQRKIWFGKRNRVGRGLLCLIVCAIFASPQVFAQTYDTEVIGNQGTLIGDGRNTAPGYSVKVTSGADLNTGNSTAISLGSGTSGALGRIDIGNVPVAPPGPPYADPAPPTTFVQNKAINGDGKYPGTGKNAIEVDSYYAINIGTDSIVEALGSENNGEAINVMGKGNQVNNYGRIHSENGAALWFQDITAADDDSERNTINNYGIISTGKGDNFNVFGSSRHSDGPGLVFNNYHRVEGSLQFGNGNDSLLFYTGSTVTGAINGGGGQNDLTLDSTNTIPGDELKGVVKNFSTITKIGTGVWKISGELQNVTKVDVQAGELTLTGNNQSFAGEILVSGPASLTASVRSLPAHNTVTLAQTNSTLILNEQSNVAYTGSVTGEGKVIKQGDGVVTMAGNNDYKGNTTIEGGGLAINGSNALGQGNDITILNGSSLIANSSFTIDDKDIHIGTGAVVPAAENHGIIDTNGNTVRIDRNILSVAANSEFDKLGNGTLVLTSNTNDYAGTTNVLGGTLQMDGSGLKGDTHVFRGATLSGTGTVGDNATVYNAGIVAPGNADTPFGALTISGAYSAQAGGGSPTVVITSQLGDNSSPTSVLHITGDSTSNYPTTVAVRNRLGNGGATSGDGILAIQVDSISWQYVGDTATNPKMFTLSHDFLTPDGTPVVAAGDWLYALEFGSGGNWYLRNYPADGTRVVIPNRPVYQEAAAILNTFNRLGTLQQRVGNRSWAAFGTEQAFAGSDGAYANPAPERHHIERAGMWTRVEGMTGKYKPASSTLDARYSVDFGRIQVGADLPLYTSPCGGTLVGGLNAHIARINAKTKSSLPGGDGATRANGYGFGGTLTWYAANGLYFDFQSLFTWYSMDIDANGMATRRQVNNNDGFGYVLSLESGRQFDLGSNGWSLTPQAQVVYSDVDYDDFVDPQMSPVSLKDADSFQARLGIALARERTFTSARGDTRRIKAYGLLNVYHEFLDGTKTQVAKLTYASRNDRTWGGAAAGGSFDWCNEKYSAYGEVGARSSFKRCGDSREFYGEIGVRLTF